MHKQHETHIEPTTHVSHSLSTFANLTHAHSIPLMWAAFAQTSLRYHHSLSCLIFERAQNNLLRPRMRCFRVSEEKESERATDRRHNFCLSTWLPHANSARFSLVTHTPRCSTCPLFIFRSSPPSSSQLLFTWLPLTFERERRA